jgi:competence ComEA-like helix-hairpin-helix protein
VKNRVPDPRGARLLCLGIAALLGLRFALPPATPGAISVVARGNGCVLGDASSGPLCSCDRTPARIRWVLGLPLPLNEIEVGGLDLLPGIGPVRAEAIARDRARRGPFRRVEELTRVEGIGPETVERLRPFLVVGGDDPACSARKLSPQP